MVREIERRNQRAEVEPALTKELNRGTKQRNPPEIPFGRSAKNSGRELLAELRPSRFSEVRK